MTRATLDTFESALLTELRAHVAERVEARPHRSIGHRMAATAAAAAVAGVIVAGAVSLRPAPAFAVERQSDGDIVVTVHELTDSGGLERALANEGITADVTYDAKAMTPSDLDNGERAPECSTADPGDVVIDPADDGGFTFTLDAAHVAAHNTVLHLTTAGGLNANDWTAVAVHWEGSAC